MSDNEKPGLTIPTEFSDETTKTDKRLKVLGILVLVGVIGCLSYVAYDAQARVDEYSSKVQSLEETIQSITAKQLADQESNLKDVEENKIVEDKVRALEAQVQNQQVTIDELVAKLSRKKK